MNKLDIKSRLLDSSNLDEDKLYESLLSSKTGKNFDQQRASLNIYGENIITYNKSSSIFKLLVQAFINPFTLILIALAIVSFLTDVFFTIEKDYTTIIIISVMVIISGALKFYQEKRSGQAAERLLELIENTTAIQRYNEDVKEIPMDEVLVGDIVHLSAGDMVPADVRILSAKDLFISQSSLTGESNPVEKFSFSTTNSDFPLERDNLAFMGTNVISGYAKAIVVTTGDDTYFGEIANTLNKEEKTTSFEKGVNAVSWVLIKYMMVMVPVVFLINLWTKSNFLGALFFAISIAIGLTPEMLPMIVTAGLSKGAVSMSKKKVIIKNLNSIQNLGAIDILCTDKTGTITEDKVKLQYHIDVEGNENIQVLKYGFLNSYYQTGLKNLMDLAIINKTNELSSDKELKNIKDEYEKIDEVPFDFNRRRLSVVVKEKDESLMITKGAVEEMLNICTHYEYNNKASKLTDKVKEKLINEVNKYNDDGFRVIAVAKKDNPSKVGEFSIQDESEMTLIGYLAFFDPPKESAKAAIKTLKDYGVTTKILTGDNLEVTKSVCRQVGIDINKSYTGEDVEKLSNKELELIVEDATIFAKVSPKQKARIIKALQKLGHSVGYMGDGINDASALEVSDVGISVDNAVDIAKEAADVILLEKDLMVLENGIIEGRKTYANIIKYIKLTASSNFGNVFSVLIASAFLPFLPMASLHLILLNLIYDISCIAIPWDNVDEEFVKTPKDWDASSVSKFMLWIGPISSIFDITTYLFMYFLISPMFTNGVLYHNLVDPKLMALYVAVFQAGWFVESMWSQTLIIHLIRTPKVPFIESRASFELTTLTFLGIFILTIIPFTKVGLSIGLHPLPSIYFVYLALTIILYMLTTSIVKKLYIRKYKELL